MGWYRVARAASPQRLRWLANGAQEGAVHPAGVAETHGFGDALERGVTGLYGRPSGLQTQALDGLCRSDPYLRRKGTGEVARTHGGAVGKALDGQGLSVVGAHPFD